MFECQVKFIIIVNCNITIMAIMMVIMMITIMVIIIITIMVIIIIIMCTLLWAQEAHPLWGLNKHRFFVWYLAGKATRISPIPFRIIKFRPVVERFGATGRIFEDTKSFTLLFWASRLDLHLITKS